MRKPLVVLSLTLLCAYFACAQEMKDIRINEVLVKNVNGYIDDYGHRSSWIELHNTGYSRVNIGGSFLKIVANGAGYEYRIPAGDPGTVISPQEYCIFFCEGTGTKGTFYTNFTLENVESIALYDASGKGDPVDIVLLNYDEQLPDVSVGRMMTSDGKVVFMTLPQTTPNATNDTEPMMTRSERFFQMDPTGGIMTLIAIIVVMSALIILFLIFKLFGNYMVGVARRKRLAAINAAAAAAASGEETRKKYESPDTVEEIAAIAMALQMYREELHDRESSVLTINKVARAYSPWSSKIYGLRQVPNLRR